MESYQRLLKSAAVPVEERVRDAIYRMAQLPDSLRDDWREKALCIVMDSELFDDGRPAAEQKLGKAACRSCVVNNECLVYALEADEKYMIYGGLTSKQREAMQRRAVNRRR